MPRNQTNPQRARQAVSRFLSNVMQPLSRILMRYGYSAREAGNVTEWSFVRSYFDAPQMWVTGKPTFVQGAIKTGLSRQRVKALNALPAPDNAIFANRQNLAYRVVEGWVNDTDFHEEGKPAPLPITHMSRPCFKTLVMKYGNDVQYGPVLKDLESAGCIEMQDGRAVLINTTYGLNLLNEDRMDLTGCMLRRLAETTGHNLVHEAIEERLMQRMWRQTLIRVERVEEAKRIISEIAIKAGREADARLSKLADTSREAGVQYVEVGLISFIYQEMAANDGDHFKTTTEKGSSI